MGKQDAPQKEKSKEQEDKKKLEELLDEKKEDKAPPKQERPVQEAQQEQPPLQQRVTEKEGSLEEQITTAPPPDQESSDKPIYGREKFTAERYQSFLGDYGELSAKYNPNAPNQESQGFDPTKEYFAMKEWKRETLGQHQTELEQHQELAERNYKPKKTGTSH